jgi:hypothetical protein
MSAGDVLLPGDTVLPPSALPEAVKVKIGPGLRHAAPHPAAAPQVGVRVRVKASQCDFNPIYSRLLPSKPAC